MALPLKRGTLRVSVFGVDPKPRLAGSFVSRLRTKTKRTEQDEQKVVTKGENEC